MKLWPGLLFVAFIVLLDIGWATGDPKQDKVFVRIKIKQIWTQVLEN